MRTATGPAPNPLDMIPQRNREWIEGEDGRVRILSPRYGRHTFGRRIASFLGRPYINVRLDAIGTAIWHECDGRATVGRIAGRMEERFGAAVAPVHERLARFFSELERSRFIRWAGSGAPTGQ